MTSVLNNYMMCCVAVVPGVDSLAADIFSCLRPTRSFTVGRSHDGRIYINFAFKHSFMKRPFHPSFGWVKTVVDGRNMGGWGKHLRNKKGLPKP